MRYCDDFIILSTSESHLKSIIEPIRVFLQKHLNLDLHPKKIKIRKLSQGIDFVGYVLEKYKLVRTRTKQRLKKRLKGSFEDYLKGKIDDIDMDRRLQSYLESCQHANQHTFAQAIKNAYWVKINRVMAEAQILMLYC